MDKVDQRVIDKAVGEWQKTVILWSAGGGQFEYKTWTFLIADVLPRYFWLFLTICWLMKMRVMCYNA